MDAVDAALVKKAIQYASEMYCISEPKARLLIAYVQKL